jgi:hypothetical protein
MLTAVTCAALLTTSCSGHDIDIGNGVDGVNGTRAGGGGSTGMTTGSPGTAGSEGMTTSTTTVPGTTAVTTGGSGGAPGTTGGTGGSAGGGSGGSTGVPDPASAIVIRYGDIPPSPGSSGTGTSTTGGTPIDPDTPYVFISTPGPTCQDPMATQACGAWRVGIGIPRALFVPGTLQLNDSRLISYMSSRGPDRGGGDCSGGGGSFFEGTLEIVDIGATTVNIRLANTFKLDFNADGAYAAKNCQ